MQRNTWICIVSTGLLMFVALTAAGATVSVQVGHLSATPLERHQATVNVRNAGSAAVVASVEFAIKPPVEIQRTVRKAVTVPAGGTVECRLPYELFEPGKHKLTCVARIGDRESVRWEDTLTVDDLSQVPQLFPDYYRRRLTIIGGREVTTSFGPLTDAGAGRLAAAARGAGVVRFADDAGIRESAVTVVPRPTTPEPVCASRRRQPPRGWRQAMVPVGHLRHSAETTPAAGNCMTPGSTSSACTP